MKNEIRCSVAMATYNGERYIAEQIESVLRNMKKNDELIISDDGSTDNTRTIIGHYMEYDERIHLVEGPQKGAIRNFENALQYVNGQVVFLCDQDDIWEMDKIDKVLAAMQEDVTLVMHDAVVVEAGTVIVPSFMRYRGSKQGMLNNIIKNSYIGCCMAFKRELLNYVLPFPERICMHDQWIGLMNELVGQSRFIEDKLLHYRRHESNVSPMSGNGIGAKITNRINMVCAVIGRMREIKQMKKGRS